MTHKVSVSSNSYNVQQKSPNKFKVSTILGASEVANLSDLQDVDITGLEDGYVLIYDGTTQKYKAVNPDEILSGAVEGGLPNDFINTLDTNLDDKIDLDAGGF
jgi:hypothetical protein